MARSMKESAVAGDDPSPRWVLSDKAAKQEKKAAKQERKAVGRIVKQENKDAKRAAKHEKAAAKATEKGEHGRVTPGNAKKIISIARVAGPAIAPYAMKAASAAGASYDRMRARRMGVPVEDLPKFSGRGASLHARIARDVEELRDLRSRTADADSTAGRFAVSAENRLAHLASAVRAAERMPTARRRATHRSVERDLNRIEDDLLAQLGVSTR